MNGFDPEYANFIPPQLAPGIQIVYTGNIYYKKQNPQIIIEALHNLLTDNRVPHDIFNIDFYGPPYGWLQSIIDKFNMNEFVRQNGIISREESFTKQRSAQLLLMLNWESREDSGVRLLKMYEYFAAARPIIATGGSHLDGVRNILETTKAGTYAQTIQEVEDALLRAYYDYKENGNVTYRGIPQEFERYNYKNMARNFSEIMNSVT
jgi:glycosyltransferase involved in cell wall biosynthesis